MRLFRGAVGPGFILMDDNTRAHRTNLVNEFLDGEDIYRTDWPTLSSDMNPVEHEWNIFGIRVAARQPPPRTIPEFRTALREEWKQLPAV